MQIDMHHGMTYVLSRLAGFNNEDGQIIATSSQFVDDAVNSGEIFFKNKAAYRFIAPAHKMIDYRNLKKMANHYSWIPFHFLPGNMIDPELKKHNVPDFVQKIICRPNSEVAQEMIRNCINKKKTYNSLHYLGVVMHVYIDSWSHQGFAGIDHEVNEVHEILDWHEKRDHEKNNYIKNYFKKTWWETFKEMFLNKLINFKPVGHGPALSFPDLPYLCWKYKDFRGVVVEKHNPDIFFEAATHVYAAMYKYRVGNFDAEVPPMSAEDQALIKDLILNTVDDDKDVRHKVWLDTMKEGKFSFEPVNISYSATGNGSFNDLYFDLGEDNIVKLKGVEFKEEFMQTHWKLIYDAICEHRTTILHDILPQYGICAA